MIGRNTLKRAVKQTAGWGAVVAKAFGAPNASPRACIFYYHRIAKLDFVDPQVDDWNVTPELFERQISALAEVSEFVPLLELPQRLATQRASSRPLVCLTFDDGYASFYEHALPVLKRYDAPATAFVVTSLVGEVEPMPFDKWSQKNRARAGADAWRAMTWDELEACAASGLVHVGAHGEKHLRGSQLTPSGMREEAEASRAALRARLGESAARAYAYPYGSSRLKDVSDEYVAAVRGAGYELAVTTDLGLAQSGSDLFRLPRIEAHGLDAPVVVKAKAAGALATYRLADHLRVANRSL
ncbi:MAG TPA: polysaccharide deacetylase family protein [Pyrinomonadaceae bacterium]|nr:polysaccharide deacetylase family protein [Pyrinomonadaceae bacterium]